MTASSNGIPIEECYDLPDEPRSDIAYRLLSKNPDDAYYRERTDRNLGWITNEEQDMLRAAVVGIAGCGGMGGFVAAQLLRLGVREVRIADSEVFDISNINRQFGAMRTTVGLSKAFVTARLARNVTDDATLVVYPRGITEESVAQFARGCDLILDEIEFWAIGSRILLHAHARAHGVPLLNCNAVGFGTRLFLFEPSGYPIESLLRFTYAEAKALQDLMACGAAGPEEINLVMERMLEGLVPELPEYATDPARYSTVRMVKKRLREDGRASILATNPLFASGFLANHAVLHLLRQSPLCREYVLPVPAPSCLYLDSALMQARIIERKG